MHIPYPRVVPVTALVDRYTAKRFSYDAVDMLGRMAERADVPIERFAKDYHEMSGFEAYESLYGYYDCQPDLDRSAMTMPRLCAAMRPAITERAIMYGHMPKDGVLDGRWMPRLLRCVLDAKVVLLDNGNFLVRYKK